MVSPLDGLEAQKHISRLDLPILCQWSSKVALTRGHVYYQGPVDVVIILICYCGWATPYTQGMAGGVFNPRSETLWREQTDLQVRTYAALRVAPPPSTSC